MFGVLDDDQAGRADEVADLLGLAGVPQRLGLVPSDEHDVGGAGQVEQGGRGGVGGAPSPQGGAVVDVEGDEGSGHGPPDDERGEQFGAAVGEGGGDAGDVQQPGRGQEGQSGQVGAHEGGGGVAAVVVGAGAVGGGVLEVDAGGPFGVGLDGGHVDTPAGEVVENAPPQWIVPDPAHPGRPVPEGDEPAGHVGLGPADGQGEQGLPVERRRVRRTEHGHGLPDADDVGGGRRGRGRGRRRDEHEGELLGR